MINSPPKLCASNSRLKSEWSLKSPSGNHSRQAGKTAALRNTDELSMEGWRVRGERGGECLRAGGRRMHCKYRRNSSKEKKSGEKSANDRSVERGG